MKKLLLLLVFLFPVALFAQSNGDYPWLFQAYGGGATLCIEGGCFGPTGMAFGASLGRAMGDRWSFELEGTFARTTELEPTRFDELTQTYYTAELVRSRIWAGGVFLGKLKTFSKGDIHIAIGFTTGFERRNENVPLGITPLPTENIGIKGGVSGGAGMNYWFSENWAIRPAFRFYAVSGNLSGMAYTAGIIRKF